MSRRARLFALTALATFVVAAGACGGSVVTNPAEDDSGTPGGDTSGVDTGTMPPDYDSSTPVPDGTTILPDGGPIGDTTIVPPPDSPTPLPDGMPGIACGPGAVCDPATEVCCVGFGGAKCVPTGTCGGGATLACTDPSVCKSGEVCCASGGIGGGGAKCTAAGSCTGYRLCGSDADCVAPNKCLPGLGGTKVCRPGGGPGFDGGGFDVGGFDIGGYDIGGFDTKFFGG
jgi:hypothetical protein